MLNLENGVRTKLFNAKNASIVNWSPDSQYFTYIIPGGNPGGFLVWGMKCPEPYRVWVWRVDDGAHDWVDGICKPSRAFVWLKSSDLAIK